jgi:hypothetical protein
MWSNWCGSLDFLARLPECKSLTIGYQEAIDLSPLVGNENLQRLQLDFRGKGDPGKLEFSALPSLKQCTLPVHPNFRSILECEKLISLGLVGGKHEKVLDLGRLEKIEEFICSDVSKVSGVIFHPRARLRALELTRLKLLNSIEPVQTVVDELRVLTLDKVPRLKIDWLAQAKKAECIALRVGEISSIKFLGGLKRLQILDLFGSKVLDKDFSVRDALKQEMDGKSWGNSS